MFHGRHEDHVAARQRDVGGDARTLLPERLLGDLDDDFLACLEQVGDGGVDTFRRGSRSFFPLLVALRAFRPFRPFNALSTSLYMGLGFGRTSTAGAAATARVIRSSRRACRSKRFPPRRRRIRRDMRCIERPPCSRTDAVWACPDSGVSPGAAATVATASASRWLSSSPCSASSSDSSAETSSAINRWLMIQPALHPIVRIPPLRPSRARRVDLVAADGLVQLGFDPCVIGRRSFLGVDGETEFPPASPRLELNLFRRVGGFFGRESEELLSPPGAESAGRCRTPTWAPGARRRRARAAELRAPLRTTSISSSRSSIFDTISSFSSSSEGPR